MSKICPNFGHIMDTFWALPCHGDIFWAMCCNCPNNGQEFRHFFGHNQPVWSYFKHILGTNWGLVTFWAHYGHFWGEMCPKCDHPYIVLQCPILLHFPRTCLIYYWWCFSLRKSLVRSEVFRIFNWNHEAFLTLHNFNQMTALLPKSTDLLSLLHKQLTRLDVFPT